MAKWQQPNRTIHSGGWFQVVMRNPGSPAQDVTFFRGVPVQLSSFSNADPFGDSTAQLSFPQITAFDDPMSPELVNWFGLFSNVDIWWVPAVKASDYPGANFHGAPNWINPITNQKDILAPVYFDVGSTHYDLRVKVWEGYVASIEYTAGTEHGVELQCQGALFQLDRYLQKPFYPPRPYPLEALIADAMSTVNKPHLRTKNLVIQWPTGWQTTIPARGHYLDSSNHVQVVPSSLVIEGKVGSKWSGYASRQTGSWDRVLTGFIQNQLALMVVGGSDVSNGALAGSQWTVNQQRQTTTSPGRVPVLLVRDNLRTPDFSLWLGTPGVEATFTRDSTQMANIAYGDGTSLDGTKWTRSVISNNGARTDYLPLAWVPSVYPYSNNKLFSNQPFVQEAYLKFDAGMSEAQAQTSAQQQLERDLDPGWTGTLTLSVDPSATMSRWTIRSGMTVKLLGIAGRGDEGLNFHISEVQANVSDGSIQLTLDSRYRDLLTVEEARARTRDPLTPTRMLAVGRTSQTIEDIQAPWSYAAGSGYMPGPGYGSKSNSQPWWTAKIDSITFPYAKQFQAFPPTGRNGHPQWYVKVNANAGGYGSASYQTPTYRAQRWTAFPILTSEAGTIRRTEMICVDRNGNILKIPFHFSIYYVKPTPSAMPKDKNGPSPYINNAFTQVDPVTGQPWPPGNFLDGDPDTRIIGWGAQVNHVFDRAGFWPGSEPQGTPCSGIFVDETPWSYNNVTGNPNFNQNLSIGKKQHVDAVTLYGMLYAEYSEPVYFLGRLYRQDQGLS